MPTLLSVFAYRLFLIFATLALVACKDSNSLSSAISIPGLEEGVHYQAVKKPFAQETNKIIVTEFFWYGCPHCQIFEEPLHNWENTLPDRVELRQTPASWSKAMELHAKIFYLIKPLDNFEEIHRQLFDKVTELRSVKSLDTQALELEKFLNRFGLDAQPLAQLLDDPKIIKQANEAAKNMKLSGISSTPSLVVNVVLDKSVKTVADLFGIADALIQTEFEDSK